jgi:hypothetical protein
MPKMTQKELESHQAEIQAWLDKGNKITICEPGARTEDIKTNMWGGKKKKATAQPVEDTKEVNTTTTKK